MNNVAQQNSSIHWLLGLSIVLLSMTYLCIVRIPGQGAGLSWITLWLASAPFVLVAMAIVIAYRAKKIQHFGMWMVAACLCLTTALCMATTRWSSVGYSFLYILNFLVIMNCLQLVTKEFLLKLTRIVIGLYFANVVITQLLVLIGWEGSFLGQVFQSQIDARIESVRYFAFADEPSYAATIVCVTYFVYWKLSKLCREEPSLVVGLMVLYQVLAFQSVYGYILLLAIVTAVYFRRLKGSLVYLAPVGLLALIIFLNQDLIADTGRLGRVAAGLVSGKLFDLAELKGIDASTFYRLGIFLRYWEVIDFTDLSFYVGHGAGTNSAYFSSFILSEIHPDAATGQLIQVPGAFIQGFTYDYGLLGFVVTASLIVRLTMQRILSFPLLILALLAFNANFNTQLFWYVVIMLAGLLYFERLTERQDNSKRADEQITSDILAGDPAIWETGQQ